MSKVGIITFYKKNYGAFLQAYALQYILKQLGHIPEAIQYDFMTKNNIVELCQNPVYFLKKSLSDFYNRKDSNKKIDIFRKSINKYLKETKKVYKASSELSEIVDDYDVFITGSDQVWNPMIAPKHLKVRLLEFVPKGKICASYAASISSKKITDKELEIIRNRLTEYDYISVREETTKNIIGDIPGKMVFQNVDPCLLLDSEQWDAITIKPDENNYLLVYKLMSQPDMLEYVKRLADEQNLKVVSLGKLDGYQGEYLSIPYTSPEKFLGYIKYAQHVVTNSFHGVVFSIIYRKRANFFLPVSSYDRALELIKNTNTEKLLEKRCLSDEEIKQVYSNVEKYLEVEKKRSIDYLNTVCGKV